MTRALVAILLTFSLVLSGCDEDGEGASGAATGVSTAASCLHAHPAIPRSEEITLAENVAAFAVATRDCRASREVALEFANGLEEAGYRLKPGGEQ